MTPTFPLCHHMMSSGRYNRRGRGTRPAGIDDGTWQTPSAWHASPNFQGTAYDGAYPSTAQSSDAFWSGQTASSWNAPPSFQGYFMPNGTRPYPETHALPPGPLPMWPASSLDYQPLTHLGPTCGQPEYYTSEPSVQQSVQQSALSGQPGNYTSEPYAQQGWTQSSHASGAGHPASPEDILSILYQRSSPLMTPICSSCLHSLCCDALSALNKVTPKQRKQWRLERWRHGGEKKHFAIPPRGAPPSSVQISDSFLDSLKNDRNTDEPSWDSCWDEGPSYRDVYGQFGPGWCTICEGVVFDTPTPTVRQAPDPWAPPRPAIPAKPLRRIRVVNLPIRANLSSGLE